MERTPIKSQQRKSTLKKKKKNLPPLLPGFELATFRSRVRCSTSKLPRLPRCCTRCLNWRIKTGPSSRSVHSAHMPFSAQAATEHGSIGRQKSCWWFVSNSRQPRDFTHRDGTWSNGETCVRNRRSLIGGGFLLACDNFVRRVRRIILAHLHFIYFCIIIFKSRDQLARTSSTLWVEVSPPLHSELRRR